MLSSLPPLDVSVMAADGCSNGKACKVCVVWQAGETELVVIK